MYHALSIGVTIILFNCFTISFRVYNKRIPIKIVHNMSILIARSNKTNIVTRSYFVEHYHQSKLYRATRR
ncbi:hypothetical protein MtrunA17_Chr8g0336131 [Medicago truncatula]|uniref:Transmembrane protein n=1 Tax=Medicago truncatula TaxID=3880 RepID=A0A396GEI5_MEDTR|nr:hypothetical protein MtrunA17_Chr8g0336131 [Medicago truncatula]